MDCQEALERYLALRSTELLPTTVQHFRNHVASLVEFLRRHYREVDSFSKLQRNPHVEGWLEELRTAQPPYANDTRRQFITCVRRFLNDIQKWAWPESPPDPVRRILRRGDFPPSRRPPKKRSPKAPRLTSNPLEETLFWRPLKRYLDVRGAVLRPSTRNHYRTALHSLINFLRARFPEIDCFSKLSRQPHIEGWLEELAKAQPPYKNNTRSGRMQSVRRFFEDIHEWGWPESPPPGLIHREDFPPPQHFLPRPLPPEMDMALMEELGKEGDRISLGLILARRAGLRVGELRRLELDCLTENPQGRFSLRVPLGKLRSERVVPLDRETAELIKKIRETRGDRQPSVDPETGRALDLLFPSIENGRISYGIFYRRLKSAAKYAGITENVHPHRLRHTYATELLRCGVTLPGVMKLLGHTNLKMTLRYVEVTNEDLGRDYLKAISKSNERYAELKLLQSAETADLPKPREDLDATFDQLVARVQALRADHPDPTRRKSFQRLIERLRRAQSELPDLLS